MKTRLIGPALVLLTAGVVIAYPSFRSSATSLPLPAVIPAPIVAQPAAQAQQVEVVFVLDTTASMSGLIATAKEKIWSIATTLAQAEQAPDIRMGLVAYRDRGDAYVTEVVDLSADLDAMYQRLMDFAAGGGGDGPESVNEALHAAVHRISWSQDTASYRVVFLVGDAPPHMDYAGEAQYPAIVRAAAGKGIIVNTIQCGDVQQTIEPWTRIAELGKGRYMKVGQSGDAFAVATPYDDEIAALASALDRTRLSYGSRERQQRSAEKAEAIAATLGGASAAQRARRGVFNATESGSRNLFDHDLVADVTSGAVELESLPPESLPEELRDLGVVSVGAKIDEISEQRETLRSRIAQVNELRAGYIRARIEETDGAEDSLERQIYDVVREQAAPHGLRYENGPEY